MKGKFITSAGIDREQLAWGELGWVTRPSSVGARQLTTMVVTLTPGMGHNFHKHPDQEEIIHVLAGEVEQWLEAERQTLVQGDTIYIAPDIVHASFNVSSAETRLLVVLGPCVGEGGYVAVEVGDQPPWNGLR